MTSGSAPASSPTRPSGARGWTRRWRSHIAIRRGSSAATPSTSLEDLIAQAPAGARVVVFHTAILFYLEEGERERLRDLARDAVYVTVEVDGERTDFCLRIDGEQLGWAQPHGEWIEWTG